MDLIVQIMACGIVLFIGIAGLMVIGVGIWRVVWDWLIGYFGGRAR